MVNMEETQHQEKERQTKQRDARIMLERQVNKEKQATLEEIKRKAPREGSSIEPKSPDHSSSSNDSFEFANDDKIDSERNSDHDDSDNDSEHENESDKSASNEECAEFDESDKDSDNVDDLTEDFVIKTHDKELEQLPKELPTQAPKKAVIQRLTNLEQKNHANVIEELVQGNVLNEVKNQLPKFLPKAVSKYVQPRWEKMVRDVLKKNPINVFQSSSTPAYTFINYELKQKLYEMMQKSHSFLYHDKHLELYNALINLMGVDGSAAKGHMPSQHKRSHDDQDLEIHEGDKSKKRRRKVAGGSLSKKSKAQDDSPHYEREEEPNEHEYKDGSMTIFRKLVKKVFNKDKITKEDMKGQEFELLKGTCNNNIELEYNMEQCHLTLTNKINWINPEGDRFHHDLSKP
uniref:Uncharacterized protein n=1 Tax=Tanacetum cinerariifolium TaxID=118510 RepID=A0A6L2LBG9_TANCI|nr:hypothetical protein [Tanacetum cinerariifolium]